MSPAASLISAAAIVFAGSAIQGSAGFGMGLAAVPVLLRLFSPAQVTPLVVALAVFMNLSIFLKLYRDADRGIILPLLLGACVGVIPGSFVPALISLGTFKFFVGLFVVLSGVILWLGWRCPIESRLLRFCVGIVSGFLNGCISLSGPPVAIFLTAGSVPKNVFRASISAYFLALNLVTMGVFAGEGILDMAFLKLLCVLVPATVLGTLAGVKAAAKIPEKIFRVCVLLLIILSGLTLLF